MCLYGLSYRFWVWQKVGSTASTDHNRTMTEDTFTLHTGDATALTQACTCKSFTSYFLVIRLYCDKNYSLLGL